AHPFHTQPALHWHHFPDLVVDACAPVLPLFRRRASILCKAPCKKSTSSTLSASARFSFSTSFTSAASRCPCGSCCGRSRRCRHRFKPRTSTPSSCATAPALSPASNRATAFFQNSNPRRGAPLLFATPSSSFCHLRIFSLSHFWGALHCWPIHPSGSMGIASRLHAPLLHAIFTIWLIQW